MFVTQALTVEVGCRAAQARFTNLLRGNWLAGVSEAAYDGTLAGLLRVGPAIPAAKLVRVRFLDPVYRGDVLTVGLRWEATGPAGGLFPVLDADISMPRAGGRHCRCRTAGPADADRGLPATAGTAGGRAGSGCAAPGRNCDGAQTAGQCCRDDHQSGHRRAARTRNQPERAPHPGVRNALRQWALPGITTSHQKGHPRDHHSGAAAQR
jgi:hypothetical protein